MQLKQLTNNKWLIYICLFLVAALLYWPTRHAKFVSDFYDWIYTYDNHYNSIADLLTCFGYHSLHQMYHIPFFAMYKLFGLSYLPWFVLFIGLHAGSAFFIYSVLKWLLNALKLNANLALIGGLVFLVFPYQTEPVVWGATIHYVLMVFGVTFSMYAFLKGFVGGQKGWLFVGGIAYVLASLTLEQPLLLCLFFPVFCWVVLRLLHNNSQGKWWWFVTLFFILYVPVYFLLNKVVNGVFIGHYGAETHLAVNISAVFDLFFLFLGKLTVFMRYIPHSLNVFLIKVLKHDVFHIVSIASVILGCGYLWFKHKHLSHFLILLATLLLGFLLATAPILNIDSSWTYSVASDRYGYLPSVFFIMVLVLIMAQFLNKNAKFVYVPYLVLCLFILSKNIKLYKAAGIICKQQVTTFPNLKNGHIYLLNLTDNHMGAHVARNGFFNMLQVHKGLQLPDSDITVVSLMGTHRLLDSVITQPLGGDSLLVKTAGNGQYSNNWFWRKSAGASSYETEQLKVTYGYNAWSYVVHFKQLKPNDAVFAFNHLAWEEIKID